MRRGLMLMTCVLAMASAAAASPSKGETKRIQDAARVLDEIGSAPDRNVPERIFERAQCAVVLPGVKKGAFVVGGEYGKGLVSCRTAHGWSAPAFVTLEKGSLGVQLGVQSTDVVLLVMNQQGMDRLLQDKVTLGAEASIAAGPVGRADAATDAQLKAEMLSYSRSQGLFAGIDLSGGVLRPDDRADQDLYGHAIGARAILVEGKAPVKSVAQPFVTALNNMARQSASASHSGR